MERGKSILVVEDEGDLADLVGYNLEQEGYVYRRASDGEAALAEVRRTRPDLIILDRMLPRRTGDDVIAQLKRDGRTASIPILMLTAKAEESDELVGFALGADDYVTKPFSMKALVARVAALLRRATEATGIQDVLTSGPITLDSTRHEVTVNNHAVALTATEFRLLQALMAAGGRLLNRQQLIDTALGQDVAVVDRTIDVHVAALRKKLGDASGWIQTVRGVGYTLRAPASVDE